MSTSSPLYGPVDIVAWITSVFSFEMMQHVPFVVFGGLNEGMLIHWVVGSFLVGECFVDADIYDGVTQNALVNVLLILLTVSLSGARIARSSSQPLLFCPWVRRLP